MLSTEDLSQLKARGISEETLKEQLETFKIGFPFLRIEASASIGNGITKFEEDDINDCIAEWDNFLAGGGVVEKFVPASGAASRMLHMMEMDKNLINEFPFVKIS